MERYNVRVILHGASPAICDMLTDAMSRMGGIGFAETPAGKLRRLRPGEFEFQSSLGIHEFMQKMEVVIRAIWLNSGLRVTGENTSLTSGVEPVPMEPSTEMLVRHVAN